MDGRSLRHAVRRGEDSEIRWLLEREAQKSINAADEDGETPLHLAARRFQDSTVRLLLEKGAQESINLPDKAGKTPLHLAAGAWFGNHTVVQLLLENGAQESVNLVDKDGKTPLHLVAGAAARRDSIVQLLLEKGAQESINLADEDGKTPLHLAVTDWQDSTVQLLLGKGAQESINLADRHGETPLHLAAAAGRDSTVRLLLQRGAQESLNLADKEGKTPLHLAAMAKSRNNIITQLLLDAGAQASINLTDEDGKTPLHLAAAPGYKLTVGLLLKGGAQRSVNLADKDGKTPLHLAAATGYSSTVQSLLEGGARESVNLADNDGKTPVHLAAAATQDQIIQVLLDGGAELSVNLVDEDGRTPLHLAAAAGHYTTVQLLLDGEALKSINFADKDGKTSLHLAAEGGHDAVVRLLLARDVVDLNPKDNSDRTPLWSAAGRGHLRVVMLLLHQDRVDTDCKDANGRTLLSWALIHHHVDVVRVLVTKHIMMNPDGSGLLQQVLDDRPETDVKFLLSEHFHSVARGSYGWLSDLRQLGLEKAEIIDLVMGAMADNSGPWISANISNVPDPQATIDTVLHQSYCAHKRRNTRTGDYKENETASFDRFSEYISRDNMQRRVSLFCGLAGVLPPGSGPLSDFGMISFLDKKESIKVIYSDHWLEPQPRNEDIEGRLKRLTHRMRAKAKETTTAVQSTALYAGLISQLQIALRGFINAAITLQKTGFCCNQFTVLTAPESTLGPDNVTIVHMNTITFDIVLKLAQDVDQLHHEGLHDRALLRSVSASMRIMETLFQTPLSLPSTIAHKLHLCSLTVQLLCLGIVFYAQAHTGKLQPSYLSEPLTRVEILGSSHDQPYIVAEQAKLACMGELVGDQVFVFRMSTRTRPIGVDGSFLSVTCDEIVDSWGPASLIMDPQEASERISGLVIRGGIIQPNGKSDHGSLPDAFGYKDKIVVGATIPAPSSHLVAKEEIRGFQDRNGQPPTGERAAVNRSRAAAQQSPETHPPPPQAQHAVQTAVTITKCPRDITESYNASRAFHLDELGSKPSRWRLTTLTANLQGGYQVLAQVGGEWQKQSAVPMKRVFLDRWGTERKLSDFESPLGLQISLCTGVARRVPLRVLVREDLMDYVGSLSVKGWKDLKGLAKDAMESKERFAKWSDELTDEQRTCVQNVFWHVLNRLKDTGFDEDGDQFSILWPYESDANRCVKVKPRNEHEWLTVLEDKEWSATC
ncbi:hypothetical protein CEP52_013946 [Fusarium oligoseptatum]|uniref:Uncharacterized protein n=1 Tax=Fusarium oligoseptatum TaxID=2604345 RepID=A0A428SR06_9HYPO|nr:hypothetical protein CEP52_013946 [Fusarium oligoseptatum]